MFRAAPRLIARPAVRAAPLRSLAPARRYISTAPPTLKSRSWKSLFARFGIAGGLIYYYNTTDVFAEEPRHAVQSFPIVDSESENLPTIESISEERKKRQAVQAQLEAQQQKEAANAQQNPQPSAGAEGGIGGLEQEADQQGAFNPETGEINWDCPCLGGMATGPCGDEFKAAFSCFVYSEEEPKGMDCIDKFKGMQDCFRLYPEIYGSEIDSDNADDDEDDLAADLSAPSDDSSSPNPAQSSRPTSEVSPEARTAPSPKSSKPAQLSGESESRSQSPEKSEASRREIGLVPDNYQPDAMTDARSDATAQPPSNPPSSKQEKSQEPISESESLVPKAAHDAGDAGTKLVGRK